MSVAVHSWREHEAKVRDLRSESLDSIATIILDLEVQIEGLQSDLDAAREMIAELEQSA